MNWNTVIGAALMAIVIVLRVLLHKQTKKVEALHQELFNSQLRDLDKRLEDNSKKLKEDEDRFNG